jgi:tetratricopeptide (TPR) repeat protein
LKLLIVLLALSLAACSSSPPLREYNLAAARVDLVTTPFFPQDQYQCGPAALATVLAASGSPATPEALAPQIYVPERQGSLQAEIVAATRRHGRVPYVLNTRLEDLLAEVAAGTPVLVLQNLGLAHLPQWHYAVVVGFDAEADSLLLRSGTTERLKMNRVRFQGTWARAANWAMVAALPDQPPATADSGNWLQAASAFEELDQPALATTAYRAASLRWPDQPLVWQALANASYAQHDLSGAAVALRKAVALAPSAAGHNNLAHVLHKQGCLRAAATEINRADAMADAESLADVLTKTRAAIEASPGVDVCGATPPRPQEAK